MCKGACGGVDLLHSGGRIELQPVVAATTHHPRRRYHFLHHWHHFLGSFTNCSYSRTWEMKNIQHFEAIGSGKVRKQIVAVDLRWVTHLMSS
ncbi:hypothetical protein CIPAW_14G119400 [Carya illinoinensis]|uniref:Uncharacterized protein n=1 Tax=Carya illinoinensis TaxID=32201 RepID=A0A8T1NE79_CARIL|nr:hypothetical protein CIPAW_14G119400 [Carya illinoinensis]